MSATKPLNSPLGVRWIHGSPAAGPADPPVQVHAVDGGTIILRQGKDVNYEAPFLYLLCGTDRALLLDTGAVAEGNVRETIDGLLADRETAKPGYELIVAHTHGHGDHVAGDGQFAARPRTKVVGHDAAAVRRFFAFANWPEEVVTFGLGDRDLRITGDTVTTTRRSPSTTRRPGSCSPGTRSTRAACTSATCRRSSPAWTGWPSSRPRIRSARCSAATSR